MSRLPTFFLNHGGGPWPWFEQPIRSQFNKLEAALNDVIPSLGGETPRAILVISSHWETPATSALKVSSNPLPPMYYDYYGFPDYAYQVRYDAPGSPQVAQDISDLLALGGLACDLDSERGFDHGTFTLMVPMRPQEDIPVVQISIKNNFDPEEHLQIGRGLAPLRDKGVLIIGSGSSFHNLRAIGPKSQEPSRAFDEWVRQNLIGRPAQDRADALAKWETAPAAKFVHPRPDHFFPLMVAAGAGEDSDCTLQFHQDDFFNGLSISNFRFG